MNYVPILRFGSLAYHSDLRYLCDSNVGVTVLIGAPNLECLSSGTSLSLQESLVTGLKVDVKFIAFC